ncbi:MAG: tRNA adenosine(34) deaminase TadA [Acholeplasmatales bacterium]|jgi:tRNA(adenine34) deaminase|nr:tRNA adenosine(34) deaminase TadA [Acholeplasmatales bacterium]
MYNDTYYIKEALKEAKKAYSIGEIPVGCVIVYNDKIIARGYNKREKNQQAIDHAEIIAIRKASKKIGSWRLDDCKMYITLEPCVMCSGAIIQSRIKEVIYGAYDYRFGCHKSITNIFDLKFNHTVNIKGGVLEEECSNIIKKFFQELRENKN